MLNGQTNCGAVAGAGADIGSETPCTFGDRTARRTIVLVGDSEADMWITTFIVWGQEYHWKVVRLVKLGCDPWESSTNWHECLAFRRFEVKTINAIRPAAVFADGLPMVGETGLPTLSSAQIATNIDAFASKLKPSGSRVLVPQNIPWFYGFPEPNQCLAGNSTSVRVCNHDRRSKVVNGRTLAGIEMAGKTHAITVVPIDQFFCTKTYCPVLVGGRVVYADEHHFTRQWGAYIARGFASVLNPHL